MDVDEALTIADGPSEPWPAAHALFVLAAEVRRLRESRYRMAIENVGLAAEVRRLRERDERVRALHRPVGGAVRPVCALCVEVNEDELGDGLLHQFIDPVPYPCPTVRALDDPSTPDRATPGGA